MALRQTLFRNQNPGLPKKKMLLAQPPTPPTLRKISIRTLDRRPTNSNLIMMTSKINGGTLGKET
jgi:hypothetical protein